jgi:hypothetical protein
MSVVIARQSCRLDSSLIESMNLSTLASVRFVFRSAIVEVSNAA